MATLTKQTIANAGTAVTLTAADAAGDAVKHESNLKLLVMNASMSSIDVTLASEVATIPPTGPANLVFSVPAGELAVIPIGNGGYRDSTSGNAAWTYTTNVDVSVAVISG